jgi:NADPH-dependent curcumin reductase CurA
VADRLGAKDAAALTERYEQLRKIVLDGHAEGWRHGLGVLTGRGVAAWMRVRTGHQPAAAGPVPAAAARGAPTGQIVAVLAQMALAHA